MEVSRVASVSEVIFLSRRLRTISARLILEAFCRRQPNEGRSAKAGDKQCAYVCNLDHIHAPHRELVHFTSRPKLSIMYFATSALSKLMVLANNSASQTLQKTHTEKTSEQQRKRRRVAHQPRPRTARMEKRRPERESGLMQVAPSKKLSTSRISTVNPVLLFSEAVACCKASLPHGSSLA